MLTLSNIREFRKMLGDMVVLSDELLKTKERQRLFDSADDVNDGLVAREKVPHDYYFFRCFTHYVELCKDKKGFYAYTENFVPSNHKLRSLRVGYTNCYRLSDSFNESVSLFKDFVIDIIHTYYQSESSELFYIF